VTSHLAPELDSLSRKGPEFSTWASQYMRNLNECMGSNMMNKNSGSSNLRAFPTLLKKCEHDFAFTYSPTLMMIWMVQEIGFSGYFFYCDRSHFNFCLLTSKNEITNHEMIDCSDLISYVLTFLSSGNWRWRKNKVSLGEEIVKKEHAVSQLTLNYSKKGLKETNRQQAITCLALR
jgi:hypothetical protein